MASINDITTYPNTPPALTDHVPGTDVSNTSTSADGETVTFTMQAMLDLFEANGAAPASFITSGTMADARIAASNVTQHEAALSVATSQITGTVATAQIADEAVTLPKLAHMATDSFLGRDTAGAGDVEVLSAATARTILNVEDGADVTDTANVTAAGALMDSELTDLAGVKTLDTSLIVESDVAGITGADQITNMVSLTQAEYDALTPNASTFYVIVA